MYRNYIFLLIRVCMFQRSFILVWLLQYYVYFCVQVFIVLAEWARNVLVRLIDFIMELPNGRNSQRRACTRTFQKQTKANGCITHLTAQKKENLVLCSLSLAQQKYLFIVNLFPEIYYYYFCVFRTLSAVVLFFAAFFFLSRGVLSNVAEIHRSHVVCGKAKKHTNEVYVYVKMPTD